MPRPPTDLSPGRRLSTPSMVVCWAIKVAFDAPDVEA
jgi:hypothetical protein